MTSRTWIKRPTVSRNVVKAFQITSVILNNGAVYMSDCYGQEWRPNSGQDSTTRLVLSDGRTIHRPSWWVGVFDEPKEGDWVIEQKSGIRHYRSALDFLEGGEFEPLRNEYYSTYLCVIQRP